MAIKLQQVPKALEGQCNFVSLENKPLLTLRFVFKSSNFHSFIITSFHFLFSCRRSVRCGINTLILWFPEPFECNVWNEA